MSKNHRKDGLTKEPLKHSPFAGLSLDNLLDSLDNTTALTAAETQTAETVEPVASQVTETAKMETSKPLTLTPAGTNELMDEDDGSEDFDPETDDGLDSGPTDTSLLPPPMFEAENAPLANVARTINAYGISGDLQKPVIGVETEPFILDAKYDDGTAAAGEPVFWMVADGSGELTLSDDKILQDGSAATSFTPDNDGPFKIVAIIGLGETEVEVTFHSATMKAAATAPTAEFHAALENALPTVSDSVPPPAAAATVTEATVEAPAETAPTMTEVPATESAATDAATNEMAEEAVAQAPAEAITAAAEIAPAPTETIPEAPQASTEETLARAEAELTRDLGLTKDDIDRISNRAPTAVKGRPAPTEEETERFLQAAANMPDTRKVSVPKASPIPQEEIGVKAATQRAIRRTHKVKGKHIAVFGAVLLTIAVVLAKLGGTEAEATSPAANLQAAATEAPQATTPAATTKLVYRCPESTRTADPSDGRRDKLTCTLVAQ